MIKIVSADDWEVIYGVAGEKIWEGHYVNINALFAVVDYLGLDLKYSDIKHYVFTDEDEIDGETPNNFDDIQGIKKI